MCAIPVTSPPEGSPWVAVTPASRLGRGLLAGVLVLVPLATLPPEVLVYHAPETPRRLLLLWLAGSLVALFLWTWGCARRCPVRWHPLDGAVLGWAGALLLATLTSAYPTVSWAGSLWGAPDAAVLWWLPLGLYVGGRLVLPDAPAVTRGLTMLTLTGGVIATLGLGEVVGQLGLSATSASGRLTATLGNSMFTGTYLAIVLPVALCLLPATASPRMRRLLGGSAGVIGIALLWTFARAAWVGTLATALLLGISLLQQAHRRPVFRTGRGVGGGLVGGLLCLAVILGDVVRGGRHHPASPTV
jgi:hypothetical protein